VKPGLADASTCSRPCDVRIGIVSWNTATLLDQSLQALPEAIGDFRAEVVVVDNASTDGSAEVAAAHPGVIVIRNQTNVGYAKAMNQALGGTQARTLIALNPDTVPPPRSLATLVRRLQADPCVALVAPRLINPDGSTQHSVYRFPSPAVAAVVSFVPPRWQRGSIGQRFWLEGASPHNFSTDIDWAIGAVHVLRAEALVDRQPYDERWFMYVEDLELCWWLARRGWRRRFENDVAVVHIGNASGAQAWGDRRTERWVEATYDWYERDRGSLAVRMWAFVNTIGLLAILGRAALRGRLTEMAPLRRIWRHHARVLLRGARPPTRPT
jgi:GT2 family glycosyltransferase